MLKQSIDEIVELAEEAKNEPRDDYNNGKRLAYIETLSILKRTLIPLSIEPEELGLDFDIDKRFA